MKFGIAFANILTFADRDGLVTLAQGAEASGFDSLWTVEHVIYPEGYESAYPYDPSGKMAMDSSTPMPDPLLWLAFVAAATETLRLATGILILPQRNPLVLAKEVATLDHLSGGRVDLGIGVGWLEEEFDALGVPFARRGARTDEYIEVHAGPVGRRPRLPPRRVRVLRRRQQQPQADQRASARSTSAATRGPGGRAGRPPG